MSFAVLLTCNPYSSDWPLALWEDGLPALHEPPTLCVSTSLPVAANLLFGGPPAAHRRNFIGCQSSNAAQFPWTCQTSAVPFVACLAETTPREQLAPLHPKIIVFTFSLRALHSQVGPALPIFQKST